MNQRSTEAGENEKARRLAAALRENLKRRKAQARGRAAGPEPSAADAPGASGRSTGDVVSDRLSDD